MKVVAVVAVIIAAVLIACSSELAAPPTQPANATAPTANPTATTAATEVPVEKTGSEATPSPALEPTAAPTATASAAPTQEPTTAPTDAPQPPTATPVPTPTPTEIHTSEIKLLKVAVAEIPAELPAYDRDDWNHWTDSDDDCQDARQEVLVAESRSTVSYRTDRGCRVAAGQWLAPYTDTVVTDPSKLDVDHMVPLGNAHDSGAWQWSANRREQYANYLDDPQHLIAVTASANRSKGARGPDQWKPEDQTYWCQYAVDWIAIKSTWELTVTEAELAGLNEMLYSCNEPPSLWVSHGSVPGVHRATSTPEPRPTATAATIKYNSCDAAQAAGETRVQGSKGNGRGFPKWMVPSARDGDGDGVVCER